MRRGTVHNIPVYYRRSIEVAGAMENAILKVVIELLMQEASSAKNLTRGASFAVAVASEVKVLAVAKTPVWVDMDGASMHDAVEAQRVTQMALDKVEASLPVQEVPTDLCKQVSIARSSFARASKAPPCAAISGFATIVRGDGI